jgi:hypothetical protein
VPVNIDLLDDFEDAALPVELRELAAEYRAVAAADAKLIALRGTKDGRGAWLLLVLDRARTKARGSLIGEAEEDVMTAMAAALRDGGVAEVALERLGQAEAARQAFRAAGWRIEDGEGRFVAHNTRTLKGMWNVAAALVGRKRSR